MYLYARMKNLFSKTSIPFFKKKKNLYDLNKRNWKKKPIFHVFHDFQNIYNSPAY